MINLKIKTLDSRDHDFSVEEDITVRQFKEHIATKTGIAADMQRLIYCGRVLNDEKPLNEYNVNGKVVHLVERAPPRTRTAEERLSDLLHRQANSNQDPAAANPNHQYFHHHHHIGPQFMRTLDIPIELPINGAPVLNPSSTLCMNRITVARHMLTCVDNIVTYLDNPEQGLHNTEMDINYQQTIESTVFEVGISANVPQHNMQNFVQAFQGAVSNVFGQNIVSNVAVTPPVDNAGGSASAQMFVIRGPATNVMFAAQTSEPELATATPGAARTRSLSETATASTSTPPSTVGGGSLNDDSSSSSNNTSPESSPTRNQTTSPSVLAEVVQQMRTVQGRLEPYLQQYYNMLLNEPQFESTEATARENAQRVYDRVSEALHYMSHAQHAMSDLMLDLTSNAPRHLSCRPILVEQSAYQSMIPIPRRQGVVNSGATANNNESAAPNNNNDIPHVILDLSNLVMPMPAPTSDVVTQTQPEGGAAPHAAAPPPTSAAPTAPSGNEPVPSVARLIQGIINQVSLYSNLQVDLHMVDDTDPANQQPEADANAAPPSDEQMPDAASINATPEPVSSATSGATSVPPAAAGANPSVASNGPPRVITLNQPTISTQTRSTNRPQISVQQRHPPNLASTALANVAFDRFLPCSSHHVRDNQAQNVAMQNFVHRRNPIRRAFATPLNINGGRSLSQNSVRQRIPTNTVFSGYIAADLNSTISLFNGSMTIRELASPMPSVEAVNRNRLNWRSYIISELGETPSEARWEQLFERLATLVNQSILGQHTNLRYHAANSVNNLVRHSLPAIVELVLNDDSAEFGTRLLRNVFEFIGRLVFLLILCVGRVMAGFFLVDMLMQLLRINNQLTSRHIANFIRHMQVAAQQHMVALQANPVDVQEFLVISLPPASVASGANASNAEDIPMDTDEVIIVSSPTQTVNVESVEHSPPQVATTPIATGSGPTGATRSSPNSQLSVVPPPQAAVDPEPLPRVLIGSEPWHANVPNAWVPIITRDIGRQRRTSAQTPYSDAYLSGMSRKRRKLIATERPSTIDPRLMLGESVRAAVRQRPNPGGVATATLAAIEQTFASTSALQAPLEQTLRTLVRNRVQNETDFDPTRYPNLDKWSSNKK